MVCQLRAGPRWPLEAPLPVLPQPARGPAAVAVRAAVPVAAAAGRMPEPAAGAASPRATADGPPQESAEELAARRAHGRPRPREPRTTVSSGRVVWGARGGVVWRPRACSSRRGTRRGAGRGTAAAAGGGGGGREAEVDGGHGVARGHGIPVGRRGPGRARAGGVERDGDGQHPGLLPPLEERDRHLLWPARSAAPKVVQAKLGLAAQHRVPPEVVYVHPKLERSAPAVRVAAAEKSLIPSGVEVAILASLGSANHLLIAVSIAADKLHKHVLVGL
eukprot:CAMPEP_0175332270 /NCGR_PEP_ID=MMETSP0095-20121207/1679_1 /TAXON_ID=311494 /ORGANISM="Alexandrium monilatum, Strain CCMP3105" /LENGTH=275 /DNA_ID=CAMNT_0016629529 /DNA_START=159 /DNA_END=987 /DNA_ORIENTATION=-